MSSESPLPPANFGEAPPRATPGSWRWRRVTVTPIVLLLLTIASTLFAGRYIIFGNLRDAALYSAMVMAILGAHEMGHFLQAVRYGVPATWPLFIPMPFSPIGTMGAVIVQGRSDITRRQQFDIGISGPLAGLVLAIPISWYGIAVAKSMPIVPTDGGFMVFGDPLIFRMMNYLVRGPLPVEHDLMLNPALFAGWVGMLVTSLNLLPIGQLDGGHILYGLLPQQANRIMPWIYRGTLAGVIVASWFLDAHYAGWLVMLFALSVMGARHPPTLDNHVPLGTTRTVLGWCTLAFLIVGFHPLPLREVEARPKPAPVESTPVETARREQADILPERPARLAGSSSHSSLGFHTSGPKIDFAPRRGVPHVQRLPTRGSLLALRRLADGLTA